MGTVFDDIELEFNGQSFTIPANKVMGVIARIEDVVTLGELQQGAERGAVPMGKIAIAFASVLRYAGARVTDAEVYAGMFRGQDSALAIMEAINVLLAMMLPPDALREDTASGNAPPAAAPSSKKPTRQRSGKSGSRRKSSGA